MAVISPSLLATNFLNIKENIRLLEKVGADYIHIDVMDGQFVDNCSLGASLREAVEEKTSLVKDVHLMVLDAKKYVEEFLSFGADMITFHLEILKGEECKELIRYIHSKGKKAGLSIRPSTKVEELFPYLKDLDHVLMMCVEPGFGGQKFMEESIDRIRLLKEEIKRQNLSVHIEVDGGIRPGRAEKCMDAGADILVSGTYLFRLEEKDMIQQIKDWRTYR